MTSPREKSQAARMIEDETFMRRCPRRKQRECRSTVGGHRTRGTRRHLFPTPSTLEKEPECWRRFYLELEEVCFAFNLCSKGMTVLA